MTTIDANVQPKFIRADQIQARSFGMDEDEAHARRVFVVVKKEKNNPSAEEIYALIYRDRDAAYENCQRINNTGNSRWVYKVRETIFSGPYNG